MGQQELIEIYQRLAVLENQTKSNGEKLDKLVEEVSSISSYFSKADGIKTGFILIATVVGTIITAKVSGALAWLGTLLRV